MSEVFGAGAGITAAIQNEHNQSLARLQYAHAQEAEQRLAQSAQEDALTRQFYQQKMAQSPVAPPGGMPAGSPGLAASGQSPLAMPSTQFELAKYLVENGAVKAGTARLKSAMELVHTDMLNDKTKTEMLTNQHKARATQAQHYSGMLEQFGDTPEGKAKADMIYAGMYGQPSPFAGRDWFPEMAQVMSQGATTVEERSKQAAREETLGLTERRMVMLEMVAEANKGLAEARTRLADATVKAKAKVGGNTSEYQAAKVEKLKAETELKKQQTILQSIKAKGEETKNATLPEKTEAQIANTKAKTAETQTKFLGRAPESPLPAPADLLKTPKDKWHVSPDGKSVYVVRSDNTVETKPRNN